MISGQPPFRGINAYQILQKVNKLQYKFPDGFDDIAKDLVKRLLVPEIETRLGHNGINDIKMHDFFKEVNWDCIFTRKPPELKPYLPASCGEPEFYSNISASEMETGLSNAVISRLMGLSSQQRPAEKDSQRNTSLERKKVPEISHEEKIEIQRREHLYHNFVDDSLIVKSGLIDKKKGLFAQRRMFLLTQNGRLFYVDPVRKVLKGEIPLSKNVATETKNFRTFFVHTVS
jgi:3-phosphoinositide dependent protein kinase-1